MELAAIPKPDWVTRQAISFIYIWLSSTWVYSATRLTKAPGATRTVLLLPVAAVHMLLLPFVVNGVHDPMGVIPTTGVLSFSAFKIIALTMGRGALAHVSQDYWSFIAACCMPVIPEAAFAASRASKHTGSGSRRNSISDQLKSLFSRLTCGAVASVAAHVPCLPQLLVYWLYIFILNMFLGAVTDCFSVFTTAVLGLKLAPCFDRPYLSATFTEFWSQRWNVTTTYLFRVMIYDPIVEGRLVATPATAATAAGTNSLNGKPPPPPQHTGGSVGDVSIALKATSRSPSPTAHDVQQRPVSEVRASAALGNGALQNGMKANWQTGTGNGADATLLVQSGSSGHAGHLNGKETSSSSGSSPLVRRVAGMQATFMLSAVWHLLLYWLLTGGFGWQWMVFFMIQGPILVIETLTRKAMRSLGLKVPRPLAIMLTNLVLILIADPLLISPLVDSGVVAGMFSQAMREAELVAKHLGCSLNFGASLAVA